MSKLLGDFADLWSRLDSVDHITIVVLALGVLTCLLFPRR